uniref:Uncharacterized protein n=1 Tax=Arundo donax TaxID=35708 RepID=A0A0A9FTE2_ARUDO
MGPYHQQISKFSLSFGRHVEIDYMYLNCAQLSSLL